MAIRDPCLLASRGAAAGGILLLVLPDLPGYGDSSFIEPDEAIGAIPSGIWRR
jgi:hypothetical protein